MYANVDQLLNKMDDLRMLISKREPDIMIFTEVVPKAQRNPIEEPLIKIAGYEHFPNFNFTDSNLGSSGIRGVVIYVKEVLRSKEVKLSNKYEDQMWVEVALRNKDSLLCGCLYRSPTKDNERTVQNTTGICRSISEAVERNNTHLLICGDFNYLYLEYPEIVWRLNGRTNM